MRLLLTSVVPVPPRPVSVLGKKPTVSVVPSTGEANNVSKQHEVFQLSLYRVPALP